MKKIIAILSGLLFALPLAANAQAATSTSSAQQIQSQAQALLTQIQALQSQLGAQGGSSATTNTPAAASGAVNESACPNVGRVLKLGSKGDDVLRLQQFLARDQAVYPEGVASGFYGALTEKAVQRWQVKYNIVSSGTGATTGYGIVGPRTAAAIALLCSTNGNAGTNTSQVGGYIQVSPISGAAPLVVNVVATVNTTNACTNATYTLNWGDNTAPILIPVTSNNCSQVAQTYQHTYTIAGNFTITLNSGIHQTSAVVSVGVASVPVPTPSNPSAPNTPPAPSGASLQAPTVTPNANGNPLAVSVGFDLEACSGYSVNWGDGTPALSTAASCTTGGSPSTQSVAHIFAQNGTYTIALTRGGRVDTIGVSISQ